MERSAAVSQRMGVHVWQVSADIWGHPSLDAAAELSPYRGLEYAIPGIGNRGRFLPRGVLASLRCVWYRQHDPVGRE